MDNMQIATEWRQKFDNAGDGGVVVIFQGEACGWVNELRDPESWAPGCIAIDEQGNQWEAKGGAPYNGAERWEPIGNDDPQGCERQLINDPRLAPDMERIRNGATQLFRRRGLDNEFTNRENADVILEPERPELYAELIEGKWYWVNGCAECNGKPRDWMTYIECEKHNVCRTCKIPRSELTRPPWGGKNGWQCKPCEQAEREALKTERLATVAAKEYDEWDYRNTDNVVCPHCESSYEPDGEPPEDKETCEVCGGEYSVEPEYSVTYTTKVVGERITAELPPRPWRNSQ